jgi:predicted anti-sigma-YlaC factor YlaD
MTQVELHLKTCETCAGIYKLQIIADNVMDHEKELQPDPFLATRIMAGIESLENADYKPANGFKQVIKSAFITLSMAAAIFFGIVLGNLSRPATSREKLPVELALIDDATIESVYTLSNE